MHFENYKSVTLTVYRPGKGNETNAVAVEFLNLTETEKGNVNDTVTDFEWIEAQFQNKNSGFKNRKLLQLDDSIKVG